jgi:ribosome biogenesis GTPase A
MNNTRKPEFLSLCMFIIIIMLRSTAKFGFASVTKRVRLGRPGTSLKMGLLGMANIGKSSTFNILSNLNVPAENMPFCTIDPNDASISVKDPRFEALVNLYRP